MKRIYSLDFFKLLFAYLIALGHFGVNVSPGGGITVQLFFIISGFFLGKKFYEKRNAGQLSEYNQWVYTKEHIKSLFPHYIFSLCVLALYFFAENVINLLCSHSFSGIKTIFQDLYAIMEKNIHYSIFY